MKPLCIFPLPPDPVSGMHVQDPWSKALVTNINCVMLEWTKKEFAPINFLNELR